MVLKEAMHVLCIVFISLVKPFFKVTTDVTYSQERMSCKSLTCAASQATSWRSGFLSEDAGYVDQRGSSSTLTRTPSAKLSGCHSLIAKEGPAKLVLNVLVHSPALHIAAAFITLAP